MENYGLDMKGKLLAEEVSTLPSWSATDERRLVYVTDTGRLYFGTDSQWKLVIDDGQYTGEHNKGWYKRPKFEHLNISSIYIYPGAYHHTGTTEQIVYWNDRITFQLGPGGSNASSSALGSNQWHFIYLHDPSIVSNGSAELDETCFLNSTESPDLKTSNGSGIYYGPTSRAIFAVKTNVSGQIEQFYHLGDYISFANDTTILSSQVVGTYWTDVDLDVPNIGGVETKATITIHENWLTPSPETNLYWRVGGGGVNKILWMNNSEWQVVKTLDVIGDKTNKRFKIGHDNSSVVNNVVVYQNGWYLPEGM